VRALAFSPAGALATAEGAVVRLWDVGTGKELGHFTGHKDVVLCLAFTRDGKRLATGDQGGTVILWDASSRRELRRIPASVTEVLSVAFTPDGTGLATAGRERDAKLWKAQTGEQIGAWRGRALKESMSSVAFSPDGKSVLLGGLVSLNEGTNWTTFYLREAKTGKDVQTARGSPQPIAKLAEGLAHPPPIAFAPDGKRWAGAANDYTIVLGGASLKGHRAPVTSLAFTSDGKRLISASLDETIRVADVRTTEEIARATKQGKVAALAVSPDGRKLASASGNRVLVRDLASLIAKHRPPDKKPEP
jgi:WD40 repeat protein